MHCTYWIKTILIWFIVVNSFLNVVILQGQEHTSADRYARISGIVTDAASGEFLPYVNILVSGSKVIGTESKLDGSFSLDNVPLGHIRLEASFLGYEKFLVDSLEIGKGQHFSIDIELSPSFFEMSEVVITATRKSQVMVSAPVSVEVVKAQDLKSQNVTTFDEAFDNVIGVNVTRSSRANVQALSIRGASEVAGGGIGNRVLLLIDGRPALSPESGGALWNLVPINSIDQIEVVKGAYSSLFGSSAMGGVINVITREPEEGYNTRVNLRYGFYEKAPSFTEFDRFNDFNSIDISHSNKSGKGGYLFDFSRRTDDGHREKSGFTLYNFYGKYSYDFGKNKKLRLSANVNQMNNDTPATWLSRRFFNKVADHRQDDFQDRREYNADIYYSVIRNKDLKYSSRLYFYQNDSEFSFNDDPGNDSTNVNFGKQNVDQSSILAQRWGNVTQFDYTINDKHYAIAGIDMSYDRIVALPDTVLYGRHNVFNIGAYFQDEFYVNDRLTITGGIRYDYYNIINEYDESNISPKIAMVFNPNKRLSIRALAAQAFRNPAIAERFIKFTQGGGLTFRPNPNLRSERLKYSFELGTRYSPGPKFMIDAALFSNYYKDLISFQQLPDPDGRLLYEVINISDALLQGFEISTRLNLNRNWTVGLAYTFLDAKDRSEGRLNDALPYKRKHSINITSSYNHKGIGLHLTGRYRSATEEVFLYPDSAPGEQLVINGRIDFRLNNVYSAHFAINNIGDYQYEELERYRMPGRHYTVGVSFNFSK